MSSHQSRVPAAWTAVYGHDTPHPTIAQTFRPGTGWRNYSGRKYISASWARKLRAEGVTHVALTDGRRVADFGIKELVR